MGIGNNRKIQLYRFIQIVKSLYPHAKSHCPYQLHINSLDLEDQLLLAQLTHSLTVLNQSYTQDGKLISTASDIANALQLLLPHQNRLTPRILTLYDQLKHHFARQPFYYEQACSKLKCSKTSLKRYLKPLLLHELVRKHRLNQRALFEVTPNRNTSLFEEMQGEWKDYQGFVEL